MEKSLHQSCVELLIKINRAHKKTVDTGVSTKIGLHRTSHIILMKLSGSNSLPSQKELADDIGVSAAAISGALDKLEAEGYIERRIGNDNRFNEIFITEAGKRIVLETRELFLDIDSALFLDISEDELLSFKKCLEKIYNNVQRLEEVN